MTLNYIKGEKVRLSDYYDEKWLQKKIEDDPSLLGLGDLSVIARERKQSSGGRVDFLLNDPERDKRYEVEVQLGPTDESHIIRTIEYWDIESRRFPSKEHIAVIVAEDITNRFFNVIYLMNKSIPIIAIQLNAIKIDDKIVLNFTKVLDTYEEPEEEDAGGEPVDRNYWENKSNLISIKVMDEVISITKEACEDQRVTYNKFHVALGTQKRNFAWFHLRKKEYCYIEIRVGNGNIDKAKAILEGAGISFNNAEDDLFTFQLQASVLQKNKEELWKLFQNACQAYK
ncbi:hypothetical protein FJZ19_00690 [Candidatus Pacearchaeota archaeon]|nr:hypothetical protein [Candidatus Pacearchaeota archaeon]